MTKKKFIPVHLNILCNADNGLIEASDRLTGPAFESLKGRRLNVIKETAERVEKARKSIKRAIDLAREDVHGDEELSSELGDAEQAREDEATDKEVEIDAAVRASLSELLGNELLGVEDVVRSMARVLDAARVERHADTTLDADLALMLNAADQLQN
jgi:hypothetical protein